MSYVLIETASGIASAFKVDHSPAKEELLYLHSLACVALAEHGETTGCFKVLKAMPVPPAFAWTEANLVVKLKLVKPTGAGDPRNTPVYAIG